MPKFVYKKCECCHRLDWFLFKPNVKYVCRICKSKKKELELEAIGNVAKLEEEVEGCRTETWSSSVSDRSGAI